jgi:pyridoxine 4-dehydrogenase
VTGTQPETGLAPLAASRVRLGLGGNRFAGPNALGSATDPQACRDVIRMACDRGLSVIDTADCYGPGFSEELIGAALQGMSERPPVATKVGVVRGSRGEWVVDVRASHLERSARASARRLRTDTIDLLQLHHPSKHSDIRDQVASLHRLREHGFVRHVGVCNVNLDQLRRAEEAGPLVSVQNHLHLRRMTGDDLRLIEYCERRGIAYLAYQPLAEGMLLNDPAVREAAREAGTTPAGLALGRLLAVASNVVPLVGTARPTHLLENVNAVVPFDAALRVGGGSVCAS